MNRYIVLLVALIAVCTCEYQDSNRYGILYINHIEANEFSILIEESIVEDNHLQTRTIEEWNGFGVYPEEVFIKDDNVELFGDFVVHPPVTFPSSCDFNGGVTADSPLEDFFSFAIEDNTGKTSIRGILYPWKGLNVNDGAFVIRDNSAETRIRDALLHADGGINLNERDFLVNPNGDIYNNEYTHIVGSIYVGNIDNDARYIGAHTTQNIIGKDTYFVAQDGSLTAGDIYLVPGTGSARNGNIFFGRENHGDDIEVTRQREFSTEEGGDVFIQAQSSGANSGGDLYLQAGDSTGEGNGGDVILAPGVSRTSGISGSIWLGTTVQEDAAFDTIIARPYLDNGDGGDTFFRGQSSENGDAGNLMVRAGTIPENADSDGGDLHISPGINSETGEHGRIILGSNKAHGLDVTRYTIPSWGGHTFYLGQPSLENNGGDMYVIAGDSFGHGQGGSLIIEPGYATGLPNGNIYMGLQLDDITIARTPSGAGSSTFIVGQDSNTIGGFVRLEAGSGFDGGDLNIFAGSGGIIGGDVTLYAGDGDVVGGFMDIGPVGNSLGGDIQFISGNSASIPGDIFIDAGEGSITGIVNFGYANNALTTVFDTAEFIVYGTMDVQVGTSVIFDPALRTCLVQDVNGLCILRDKTETKVPDVDTTAVTVANQYERVRELQNTLNALVNSFGQCGHGFVTILDSSNQPRDCPAFA